MKKTLLFTAIFYLFASSLFAQKSQGIGTNTPNPRAVLDINAEQPNIYPQGILLPRLTTAQRNSLGTVAGLSLSMTVFDTDLIKYFYWNGTVWTQIAEASAIASYFTLSGTNIRTLNNSDNIQLASTAGAYMIGTNTGLRMTDKGSLFLGNSAGNMAVAAGPNNIFIGTLSGSSATNGGTQNNVFIGTKAGRLFNGAVSNNVFIGNEAGGNSATGSHNVFFGLQAGSNNAGGNFNNFIGRQAGFANTTGSNNNFLGDGAGGTNSTGSNNNFLGDGAGGANISGSNNIFIGTLSGTGNTLGSDNIALGKNTVFQSNNLSNSIVIGSNTSTSGSNQVVIGNNITGLGINTAPTAMLDVNGGARIRALSVTGSVLTVDNLGNLGMGTLGASSQWTTTTAGIFYSSGNVGIGTNSPLNPLHVVANSTSIVGMFEGNTGIGSPVNIRVKNNGGGGSALALEYGSGNLFAMTSNTLNEFALYSSVANKEFVNYAPTTERLQISNSSGSVVINASATGIGVQTFTGFEALRIGGLNPTSPKGFVLPYVTTAQMATLTTSGLTSLDAGMLFFNTDKKDVEIWDGTQWQNKNGGSGGNNDQYNWNVGGNTITGFSFVTMTGYGKIGTNENFPVAITTGNQPRIFVNTTGGVGIGFASNIMKSTLQINGDVGLGDGTETGNKPVVVWLKNSTTVGAQGDIVIVGTGDDTFTVTNVAGNNSAIGVLIEPCTQTTTPCKVAVAGVVTVNVTGGAVRGQHCVTSGTAGQAASTPTPNPGASIGVFLQTSAGSSRVLLR